jgi:hypothetical protein
MRGGHEEEALGKSWRVKANSECSRVGGLMPLLNLLGADGHRAKARDDPRTAGKRPCA